MKRTSQIHTQPMPAWSSSLPYWTSASTSAQPLRTRRGTALAVRKLRAIRAIRASRRQRATPGS
jgi:hypothetical protein